VLIVIGIMHTVYDDYRHKFNTADSTVDYN